MIKRHPAEQSEWGLVWGGTYPNAGKAQPSRPFSGVVGAGQCSAVFAELPDVWRESSRQAGGKCPQKLRKLPEFPGTTRKTATYGTIVTVSQIA